MVTALYRRYRPETFAEMIGQSQVTDPLRTALRTNRVNHAYLFSGPRGCGKTTSARILARCLNCAQGPTDTPCGTCDSCVELSRDGGGSLDVVEIDAASHNGVDDARDLRERAIFAPARDRYKIFILDEAHMVTPQGFNALLKIVEEPPEHVKFIFATTEPDKVIGTIRSRTHHYPFRLIPPAQMLDYVGELCESEGVTVAAGVLPLVVRAGGGSARDTLSLLDQLMAGSEDASVDYERAVSLLGYTHTALLDEVVDALAASDAAAVFGSVDRVIQTGQDPRRFVDDLLERLRDLIVVAATSEGAAAVMRGMPQDELDRMSRQAQAFGPAELSRSADLVGRALSEMSGATSPRLHLELMMARILVPAADATARGALARVERLERRIGVDSGPVDSGSPTMSAPVSSPPMSSAPAAAVSSTPASSSAAPVVVPTTATANPPVSATASPTSHAPASQPTTREAAPATTPNSSQAAASSAAPAAPGGPVSLPQLKDAWPEVLERVGAAKRGAWMVAVTATVRALEGDVLTLTFPSQHDVESFKQSNAGQGVSEILRQAILDVLGMRVKYIAKVDGAPAPSSAQGAAPAVMSATPVGERPVDAQAAPAAPVRSEGRSGSERPNAPSGAPRSDRSGPQSTGRSPQGRAGRVSPLEDDVPPLSDDDAPPDDSVPPPLEDHERTAGPQRTAPQRPAQQPSRQQPAPQRPAEQQRPADRPQSRPDAAARPISDATTSASTSPSAPAPTTDAAGWHVVAIPGSATDEPPTSPAGSSPDASAGPSVSAAGTAAPVAEIPEPRTKEIPEPRTAAEPPRATPPAPVHRAAPVAPEPSARQSARYGEAVVREILGARFIEEQPYTPPSRFTP
ncbi:DNA polymerase III subunit gamma and tau [Labedella endophytica]|uniref:DNA-directed DNA polymerase n=1 Tax=Labedella endophytica TaxID=1523160 RepID=A0A433JSZ5_9MICO|nr:DNA polymerase III subunit gamma and tau [Labedella endophytica]RUR01446.1 DNA polymerase III subunit gamma and tau [Labedella endophytica]